MIVRLVLEHHRLALLSWLITSGQPYIRNFCPEGYFVGALASLLTGTPSDRTIEAIEPAQVWSLEYRVMEDFFSRSALWERYALFRREHPYLDGRVSQADVAGYIGVTPVSLSRALGRAKRGK